MARPPSYTNEQYQEAVELLKNGETMSAIAASVGISPAQVGSIRKRAVREGIPGIPEAGTRGPRKASPGRIAPTAPPKQTSLDRLLAPFMPTEEANDLDASAEKALQLREELTEIQKERIATSRRLTALAHAEGWWQLRIARLERGEEDPGESPPEDWSPDDEAEEEEEPRKIGRKKFSRKKKTD